MAADPRTDAPTEVRTRKSPLPAQEQLVRDGVHPVLAHLFAGRGVRRRAEVDDGLATLLPPDGLRDMPEAVALLTSAIAEKKRIVIVADYDCDGATACAIGVRGLRAMGADVDFIVPDRFKFGYGLTPEIVALAAQAGPRRPDLLVTVDNGIASIEGVDAARELGMAVLVTDHHLPGDELPRAAAIVNPNQPGCDFSSKSIAGCGVMFYVLLALRAGLRKQGAFKDKQEPNLAELLDLVAIGTVADVVQLDHNNRVLVAQGLKRIRSGRMHPGVRALFAAAGRDPSRASSFDLGFLVGPRLNAAGRLTDMRLGIACLLTDDYGPALEMARQLDDLNRERRSIEADMRDQAEAIVAGLDIAERTAVCLYDPSWHQGVVGIVAGRMKDRLHRPVIVFARGESGELKGSGRSIPGLHLRDALDLVAKRHPHLISRFGGHAAAAGLTLNGDDVTAFNAAFEAAVTEMLGPGALARTLDTDGPLEPQWMSLETARMLEEQIWGQGFPQPLYVDLFEVAGQRVVGERHTRLRLVRGGRTLEAMHFNSLAPAGGRIRAAYRLSVNEYNGVSSLQLIIEHREPA